MKVTIVIATANRAELLVKCLKSLLVATENTKKTQTDFEFIIVVNGPCPKTKKAVDDVLQADTCRVLSLMHAEYPGAARNQALELATGEWIFFADDDICIEEDFFNHFLQLTQERPSYSVLGGPNLNPSDSNLFQQLSGYVLGSYFASFYCAQRYRLKKERLDVDDTALTLCNLFVRRSALSQVRFSPELICAEENSLLAELAKNGQRFLSHPELKVFHERRVDYKKFSAQIRKYGYGRGQLMLQGQIQWFHLLPLLSFLFAISSLFLPALRWPVIFSGSIYLIGLVAATVTLLVRHQQSFRHFLKVSGLIFSVHLHYALGLSSGFFSTLLEKPAKTEISERVT